MINVYFVDVTKAPYIILQTMTMNRNGIITVPTDPIIEKEYGAYWYLYHTEWYNGSSVEAGDKWCIPNDYNVVTEKSEFFDNIDMVTPCVIFMSDRLGE